MIKIYLLDFSEAEGDNFSTSALPDFVKETKNVSLKKERTFSYLLLSYAYREIFGEPMPEIKRDGHGRPHFVSGGIDFNISHSDSLAALIISDEGKVGVDIQKTSVKVSEALIEKVDKTSPYIPMAEKTENPFYLKVSGGKIIPAVSPAKICDGVPFFKKWTEQEALAKADGRGLCYLSKIFAEDFILISETLLDIGGDVYAFAAVKEK